MNLVLLDEGSSQREILTWSDSHIERFSHEDDFHRERSSHGDYSPKEGFRRFRGIFGGCFLITALDEGFFSLEDSDQGGKRFKKGRV